MSVAVGPVNHKGIISDRHLDGRPMVISNSKRAGRVCEESWDAFCAGEPVQVVGYLGVLAPELVLERARSVLGKGWNLFSFNCEHLVSYAHGLEPRSPQLASGMLIAGIAALVYLESRDKQP